VATFAADAVPAGARGVLVLVLAGEAPAVIAATSPIDGARPVALSYRDEALRPTPLTTPIVFVRGTLVGAAPVGAGDAVAGAIAALVAADGRALASAVVLNVVGDTATLEVLGGASADGASGVVFAGSMP
jgi:hypothetical protein